MNDSAYDIVFRGRILEGMTLEAVKMNLAKQLKRDTAQLEQLFARAPVVIKRNVGYKTGLKLVERFETAGLVCEMRPRRRPCRALPGEAASDIQPDHAVQEKEPITCPKCGSEQSQSLECIQCGIIFSKFKPNLDHDTGFESVGDVRTITDGNAHGPKSRVAILSLILLVVAFGAYRFFESLGIKHPPGILVASTPRQVIIGDPKPWSKSNKIVVPLAEFSLRARVISKERYRFDATADISPIDLVLGWGPMSDQGILDNLDIVQGNRRFVMVPVSSQPPLPLSLLMECSSNMHMIPADDMIADTLENVRTGEIIELDGYLVGIQEAGQWSWVSSLSRKDTGDGACEIIWVRRLRVLPHVKPIEIITPFDSRKILAHLGKNSYDGN